MYAGGGALVFAWLTLAVLFGLEVKVFAKDVPTIYVKTNDNIGLSLVKDTGDVDATISMSSEQTQYDFNDISGSIKVRGNSTAGAAKKPYTIKFAKKQNVLGLGSAKKWVLLANCFDPTLQRNYIAFSLAKQMGLSYTPDYVYVDLYLDDNYLGNYLLTESVEVKENRVELDIDEGDFLIEYESQREDADEIYLKTSQKGYRFILHEPEEASEDQQNYVKSILDEIENILMDGNIREISKIIDLSSFVDFYILNEYMKTNDISWSSVYFYYKNGKLYAGPAWDYDLSSGNSSYIGYTPDSDYSQNYTGIWVNAHWYRLLNKVSDFQNLINYRYVELQPVLKNEIPQLVEDTYETYKNSFDSNFLKWDISRLYSTLMKQPEATYEENKQYLKNWFISRNQWLLDYWGISEDSYLINYMDYLAAYDIASGLDPDNYYNYDETGLAALLEIDPFNNDTYDTQEEIDDLTDSLNSAVGSLIEIGSVIRDGSPYVETTDGIIYDVETPHILINQVYGGGADGAYASNSFIELVNPTNDDVDITGWSLQYRSSTKGGSGTEWNKLVLSGVISAHCSYLVRCKQIDSPKKGYLDIKDRDIDWDQNIYNKGCSVVLVANRKQIDADSLVFDNETGTPVIFDYVDMVGVSGKDAADDEFALFYEGATSQIQSKKFGIRRKEFKDTDDNTVTGDFEAVDYSKEDAEYRASIAPRCSTDGRWKAECEFIQPVAVDGLVYDSTDLILTSDGAVTGGAITFALGSGEEAPRDDEFGASVPTGVDAGTYRVWFRVTGDEDHFDVEPAYVDVTISRAVATVTATDSSKIYGETDHGFTAEVTGLQGSDAASSIVYTLFRASGEGVGTYTILPVGNTVQGNYEVVYAEGTFTINAKTVTAPMIVLSSDSFVYDGTEKTPGITVMDGSTVIDPNEYNVNISNNTAAGTATVTITDKDGGNYIVSGSKEFTISKAIPTILIAPEAGALVYGQSLDDSAVTGGAVSVAGTFAWDNAEIIPSVANSDVTEYSVVFTPVDTDNYDIVKFGVKVSVAKAEPQYTVPTGITAVYGDTLAGVELPEGWAWADGIASVGDVGVHSFDAIYTPVDTVNYNNAEAQIEISVGKDAPVLTVPVAKANLTYTGTAQEMVSVSAVSGGAISFAVTYSDGVDLVGVPGEDAFSSGVPTGTSAGTYTVWYKVTGDNNHLDTEPASLSVVIGRASAVVYVDNSSKAYGEADPALSATVSGLKGSDIQDVLSYSLFRSAGESVGTYNIIAMGDAVQGNYNVSYVQGAFTIETKAVTDPVIVLSQDSFVYDGTAKTPSVTVRVGNTIIDPSEYTVTYSNNVEAGTATATITDKVGGSFEISGSVTFTITEPETENQGGDDQVPDNTQSGYDQGEGQSQDETQSGTEQDEGQGQDETQNGTEQGEGQGQDDTQSGTEQDEGQGQSKDDTQSGTEQGNAQNQSGTEQGSQQSSTDNSNSGYVPVFVPNDNTSDVVNDLSNTGSQNSGTGNIIDGKDTETGKDTDKDSDIPSLTDSVRNVIEIATSELFESLTKTVTGGANESDVVVELKVSKTKITVKKGKTSKIKPKLVTKSADGTTQTVSDVSKFRFISLNPSVAKVSKKGTVTGTSSGSCTIYVIAQNGMVKQIKVTVK